MSTPTATNGTTAPVQSLHDRLTAIARNLWWTWQPDVFDLFLSLDPQRWRELHHNPIALLAEISPEELERRATILGLHGRVSHAFRRLQEYVSGEASWGEIHAGPLRVRPVAYFSAEFCLHESIPIYSGGLGVLAGDHLKSASDLDVPLIGVGIYYRQGYFVQRLDETGLQHEEYLDTDVEKLPMELARDPQGEPLHVTVATRTRELHARVWKLDVGRTRLLLLDTNVPENAEADRGITARLYGGDERTRIAQELLLGVGGMRALTAAGIFPAVVHLNEGHSAFATFELARQLMEREGLSLRDALGEVASRTVFTTHTPVPAGHDRFGVELLEEHLGPLRESLGISVADFRAFGKEPDRGPETFCMTVLGLKLSRHANGVSALHGRVSRRMWAPLWPSRSEEEVPIGHITNGVHVFSWLAPQMRELYDRTYRRGWIVRSSEPETWEAIEQVPPGELWEVHLALKRRLVAFLRERLAVQHHDHGAAAEVPRPSNHALTIGFARRFAAYKRAALLLSNPERLVALLKDPARPVQIVFAGEAHPRDEPGKAIVKRVASLTADPRFAGHVFFVEDYDMHVTRYLVQGVDLWLNTPRRPLEASGTSGQKAVLNGVLNLSVLDGWWAEAYDGANGFAVGRGETNADAAVQDERDAESLFRTLEGEVIPTFWDRDADGLPLAWIRRMRRAIRTLGWRFNAERMVRDYVDHAYLPACGGVSWAFPAR